MAKDPAFLFYSSDFLSGVQDLTMEERGQYITLLCLQHQKGHLSSKTIKLATADATADVMAKFRQDPAGLWYNERLEEEVEKRKVHSKKQSERAIEGWKKRKHDATPQATADATALPLEDVNENEIINTSKELCKIFGKQYLAPKDRLPATANWYMDIDRQAKEILSVWSTDEAEKQIDAYLKHCRNTNRKVIGTAHKVAETLLSSNWLELLGEAPRAPSEKFKDAAFDKTLWTLEAWEDSYKYKLKHDNEFRKHFGYGELQSSMSVGGEHKN